MTPYLMNARTNTNEKDHEERAGGKGNTSIGTASSGLVFPTSFTLCFFRARCSVNPCVFNTLVF